MNRGTLKKNLKFFGQGGLRPNRTSSSILYKNKKATMELYPLPSWRLKYWIWSIGTALTKKEFLSPSSSLKKKEKKKRKHTNLHSRFRNGKKLVKLSHPEPLSEEECRWTLGQYGFFPLILFQFFPRRHMSSNQLQNLSTGYFDRTPGLKCV